MKVQNINMCIKHFLRIFCESFENQVREMLGVFEEKASKCFFFFFNKNLIYQGGRKGRQLPGLLQGQGL